MRAQGKAYMKGVKIISVSVVCMSIGARGLAMVLKCWLLFSECSVSEVVMISA